MSKPIRFWNFKNETAESVTLRIDGVITDDDYAWLYEWFEIPAASPNKFRNELAKYAGKNIELWINSPGGSVFAAVGIYDALMEHKNTGAKITSIAEKVMSAGTLPYMAGDERQMTLGGVFMTHNPLPGDYVYGYASDLRKVADVLDEIKEAIINIYQYTTGLLREKISSLMDDETYMNANTAIKEGFATEIRYPNNQKPENKPLDAMNFITFNRFAVQNAVNIAGDSFKKFLEITKQTAGNDASQTANPPVANKILNEGSTDMEIKTVDDLKKVYPEFVNQIETTARAQGAKTERDRIKNIEAISKNIDPTLVNKSKFETPIDAKELAFQAMQANAAKNQQYLTEHAADVTNSNTNSVTSAAGEGEHTSTENVEIHNAAQKIAKNFRS